MRAVSRHDPPLHLACRRAASGILLLAAGAGLPGCTPDPPAGPAALAEHGPSSRARRPTTTTELRGVWVSDVDSDVMRSFANMESLAGAVSRLNMNAIYPVVWSQGETFYPSEVMARYGAPSMSGRYGLNAGERDPMADWVSLGARYDLDVVPWFEWGAKVPAESALARSHPEWISRDESGRTTFDQDGTPTSYLNVAHPGVRRFFEELAAEFVTRYDVPAIQFDDHLALRNTFGYDDHTLALHRAETGRTGRPAPDDAAWLAWRASKLTQLVSGISRAIREARPGIELSVAPNPYPWSFTNYVQDWPAWVESGLVDEVVVQVYRDTMPRFAGELGSPVLARLRGKARLAIGVLAGQKPKPVPIGVVREQTAMVRESGYSGVVYFFQESLLRFTAPGETVDARLDGIRSLFPEPARPR